VPVRAQVQGQVQEVRAPQELVQERVRAQVQVPQEPQEPQRVCGFELPEPGQEQERRRVWV